MTLVPQSASFLSGILLVLSLHGAASAFASGGEVRFAGITVDTTKRELRFEAQVNQQDGLVEYLLVHSTGKTHESVLSTGVRPADLHAAALLLGWVTTNQPGDTAKQPIVIQLKFPDATASIDAARVVRLRDGNEAPALLWRYGGSVEFDGKFLAQQEGSIVTLIEDDAALVQSLHAERVNDDAWFANGKTLPRIGTRVEVILRAEKPPRTNKP